MAFSSGKVINCTNRVNVRGSGFQISGIAASHDGGEIKDCNNYGNISGKERVGGIVGRNIGSISNCMSAKEATVQGEYLVGGIVGINENNNTITDCYNLSQVTSTGGSDFDGSTVGTGAYTGGIART